MNKQFIETILKTNSLVYNPNWLNEDLKCHFCGETKSVKYKTKIFIFDTFPNNGESEKEVCACNKCALKMIDM